MKLNEAIILTESFKDLKTILKSGVLIGAESFDLTNEKVEELIMIGANVPHQRVTNVNQFVDVLKWGIQHPSYSAHRHRYEGDFGDVSTWIRNISSGRFRYFAELDIELGTMVLEYVIEKEREKAHKREIKKTSMAMDQRDYVITELDSYAKSRAYCNRYFLSWCIGASSDLHYDYGELQNRRTYAVMLPDGTHIAIHSGPDSWLITSGDNRSEIHSEGSARNPEGLTRQVRNSGISSSGIEEIVRKTIHPSLQRFAIMELTS